STRRIKVLRGSREGNFGAVAQASNDPQEQICGDIFGVAIENRSDPRTRSPCEFRDLVMGEPSLAHNFNDLIIEFASQCDFRLGGRREVKNLSQVSYIFGDKRLRYFHRVAPVTVSFPS